MPIVTQIRFSDFVILSALPLQWAEIEGVLYATDGSKTWELREIAPDATFTASKGTA
jgi:hypothetical protein